MSARDDGRQHGSAVLLLDDCECGAATDRMLPHSSLSSKAGVTERTGGLSRSRERRSRERHHPRPKHHIDFLAASDEFPKWAESLCMSLTAMPPERPEEFVTDVCDAMEQNLRSVSR